MISRRQTLYILAAAAAALTAPAALAFERVAYTPAAFDAAQKAGRPILVEIQAPWCPTCRAQTPILGELEDGPEYSKLLVVHVDFDSQKDAVRRFRASKQSTLIAFKGDKEMARSVGETDPGAIAQLLRKTLG